ncbi:MAG TPA: hypothetical protein VHB51_00810 [Candidatus Saccharimonadales bacterium]|nr:hypothetical protein [Candidatus Saccharimonadales bacterium]
MKRIILMLLAPLVLATATVGQAAAVDLFQHCGKDSAGGNPAVCQDVDSQGGDNGSNNPVIHTIKIAIEVLSWVIGIAAIIGVVVSGMRMALDGGDSSKVAEARNALTYSLIGVAIAILAQTIVVVVLDRLT